MCVLKMKTLRNDFVAFYGECSYKMINTPKNIIVI